MDLTKYKTKFNIYAMLKSDKDIQSLTSEARSRYSDRLYTMLTSMKNEKLMIENSAQVFYHKNIGFNSSEYDKVIKETNDIIELLKTHYNKVSNIQLDSN